MNNGEGLAILKYEGQKADQGYDPHRRGGVAIDPRRDETLVDLQRIRSRADRADFADQGAGADPRATTTLSTMRGWGPI